MQNLGLVDVRKSRTISGAPDADFEWSLPARLAFNEMKYFVSMGCPYLESFAWTWYYGTGHFTKVFNTLATLADFVDKNNRIQRYLSCSLPPLNNHIVMIAIISGCATCDRKPHIGSSVDSGIQRVTSRGPSAKSKKATVLQTSRHSFQPMRCPIP